MKRGKLISSIFLFLVIISFANATTTEISVKTMPFNEVQLVTHESNTDSFTLLERFKGISDRYGDISFNFTSNKEKFDIIIFIKDLNGNKIMDEKYPDQFEAGEPVYIEIATSNFEFIPTPEKQAEPETPEEIETNLTKPANIETPEQEDKLSETSSKILGFVIGEDKKISKQTLYYIGGTIVLIILILIFLKLKKKTKKDEPKEEKKEEKKYRSESEELKKAEEDLKKAQEEINKIKNKDKIAEAKRKLIEDEKELMRLRKGE